MAAERFRVLITGSSDGLGRLAAQRLVALGHRVVLHARNAQRARDAQAAVPEAEGVLVGDLSRLEAVQQLAEAANASGPFDAVIHNAGVYRAPGDEILNVNTLAPYLLTCLIRKPRRLIYLSSGLHRGARPDLKKLAAGSIGYAESKFYVVLLAKAVARRWPDVYANAVDPGWVPTKMGGPEAPDSLEEGVATQVWLAVSDDPRAKVSGRYFYHMREVPCHPLADEVALQEAFLETCAQCTGVRFPSNPA
ncbi:SDR family NAD(P)-dependent oxidoreductase [Rhodothermus marinus]|uniref:SDR family NAD(P)-dependent oxidoreductase n=1 Tax=Rhodothermus marinus TaxID=29549 RepID=UPI0037CBC2B4